MFLGWEGNSGPGGKLRMPDTGFMTKATKDSKSYGTIYGTRVPLALRL